MNNIFCNQAINSATITKTKQHNAQKDYKKQQSSDSLHEIFECKKEWIELNFEGIGMGRCFNFSKPFQKWKMVKIKTQSKGSIVFCNGIYLLPTPWVLVDF